MSDKPVIKVERRSAMAKLPERGSVDAIGIDVFADLSLAEFEFIEINPGEVVQIPCGWAMQAPEGHYLRVAPKSGLAVKNGIDVLAGVIDRDYTGEVQVVLTTHRPTGVVIKHGQKIAQVIAEAATLCEVVEATLDVTVRGAGGFGSTGNGLTTGA